MIKGHGGGGGVQGVDCAGFFTQWGLQKDVLRDIWEVVAGDEGRLSQGHFLGCLYLMELAKRGVPPPRSLPPGPFPPIASTSAMPDSSSSFSLSGLQQVEHPFCDPEDLVWFPIALSSPQPAEVTVR